MESMIIPFEYKGTSHLLELAFVPATPANDPFMFGDEQPVQLPGFYIATTQTTQAFWKFLMGEEQNRSQYRQDDNPVEHVSWHEAQKFIANLNERYSYKSFFRLPTESEWEYAARGGPHWHDGFHFAGSNNMDESGWYEGNAGPYTDLQQISQLKNAAKLTTTHPVGLKKSNQIGLHDTNGNLWEWCQDWYSLDTNMIPKDGSAYDTVTQRKVLRGGCHHNGAIHCTNTKRYEIGPEFFDGCIGFRLAASAL